MYRCFFPPSHGKMGNLYCLPELTVGKFGIRIACTRRIGICATGNSAVKLVNMGDSPVMPIFRGTVYFAQPALVSGWTETYYMDQPSHDAALLNLSFIAARRNAMNNGTTYQDSIRVSNVDHPRDVRFINYPSPLQGRYDKVATSDVGWTALLFNLRVSPSIRGKKFLRGIPDSLINVPFNGQEIATFTQQLQNAVNDWTQAMIQGGVVIRSSNKNPTPPPSQINIRYSAVIQAVEFVRVVSRRIGRPFGLRRGRQRNRG